MHETEPFPHAAPLLQVSRKEMQATLALRFGGEGILKMKGIPFKATAADVRKFFSAYKIKPEGIRWGWGSEEWEAEGASLGVGTLRCHRLRPLRMHAAARH